MKPRTVIVSDLHLGGGAADPGDDHVYQDGQLIRFVEGLACSEAGRSGGIELFVNGDFLEFAQTANDAYESVDSTLWCSERESCVKLDAILAGHSGVFAAVRALLDGGNAVTIAAGNHDVDLYWPQVQRKLREATSPALAFETGREWVERYGGRLQIAHGHLPDPANTFDCWDDPVRFSRHGEPRLAMCPGTLFMQQFVNGLERRYPFADNLHPVQSLARLLLKDDRSGFAAIAWAFVTLIARNPMLLARSDDDFGRRLLEAVRRDDALLHAMADAASNDVPSLRERLRSPPELAAFLLEHWPQLVARDLHSRLSPADTTLAAGRSHTLGALAASADFGKDALRRAAVQRARRVPAAEVVVMGHTHIADDCVLDGAKRYFNPGSWTRYVDMEKHPQLRLEDLAIESRFPYSLNYVDIELRDDPAPLRAELKVFERQAAEFS